ncbi:uncharacterized mitochondrial protein AtMg00810-like [Rutidosis leptorrhynchoides]|uniref:uncharacterized mitochondrial protein AtMg00810-like n=1 Tax=Rutidosis leptorrhynchoides TaxID=125765 RepID=UPI003A99CC49
MEKETGMIDCKPAETPMIPNQKLFMEDDVELVDKGQYQRIVGKLIYLAHTRPNIAHAEGVVSQFMHQSQVHHLEAAMGIIRYLKKTSGNLVAWRRTKQKVVSLSSAESEFREIAKGVVEALWI